MTNAKFNRGATIKNWTFMWIKSTMDNPDGYGDIENLRGDINEFHRSMREAGINISDMMGNAPPVVIPYGGTLTPAFNNAVMEHLKRLRILKTEFLLVILPCMDVGPYRLVKKTADRNAAVHTVCMIESKLKKQKGKAQYLANVALKFNLKAGGINQRLDEAKLGIISEGKTMVVGIDVTHPSPESRTGAPSIAGVVASVDKYLAQWPAAVGYQSTPRCEMVSGLEGMLLSRLKLWKEKNSTCPENILVYRDGVSEGQYQKVLSEELPLLRQACTRYYSAQDTKRGLPRITIIIVGKRHHTRFYPVRAADADSSSNCRNGTVVDRGVTEVRYWHFFLQAHTCLQGTAKPAHYYVILDEIFRGRRPANPAHRNAADVLEELTYNMCFLFGRATKSVSICPPAYYADLVCERARLHMGDVFEPLPSDPVDDTSAASASDGNTETQTPEEWKIRIHDAIKNSMYYI
jgi:eukaryotic translation initiation factor 2C